MTRKNTIGISRGSEGDEKYKKQQGENPGFRINFFGITYHNTCKIKPNKKIEPINRHKVWMNYIKAKVVINFVQSQNQRR